MLRPRALLLGLLLVLAAPADAPAIVGGETTQRDWPHMAAMEFREDGGDTWDFRCGGSLIRQDVILTAAHCVDAEDGGTYDADRFRFLLGTKTRSRGGERLGAEEVVEHPDYDDSDGMKADVALVRLERSSSEGRTIRIAGSGDRDRWEPGDPAVVIGWGTEFFGSPLAPDDLKEAEVPIVADDDCQTSYRFRLGFDPETNVCAGNLIGGEDSCQGDSGGPLHVEGDDGWVQVGVVSYGLGCAFPTQYGVYAEAGGDALRGWIAEHADALSQAGEDDSAPVAPAPPAAAPPAPVAGALAAPLRARLILGKRLRASRRLTIRLATTQPLRSIVVTLRRGRRTLAVGRRASLRSPSGRVVLRRRRGIRPGRAVLRLRAVDATGRRVSAVRRVRLSR